MYKPCDFCLLDSRKRRKGGSPKLESKLGWTIWNTAFPNRAYRLKDYKDVVNESRLKLYYAVDATAVNKPDDRQGISVFEPDILSVEDNHCEDAVCSEGAHCNISDDQQTSSTEKQKAKRKWLIIENSGWVGGGGQQSPNKSTFSQSTDRRVGRPTYINKGKFEDNSPCISRSSPNTEVDQDYPRRSTCYKKTPLRLGY